MAIFWFRKFEHSFRSGESVLGAVDEVFKAKEVAASVTADSDGFPPHIALPDAPPSVVEIWEPMKPDERSDIEGWDAPFDTVSETSPRVKLAQRIARTVRRLVDDRTPVGIDGRAARYGDVLVLVRQRGPLFEAIIRALKNEKLDVAGADRLLLTEHIAVMDLHGARRRAPAAAGRSRARCRAAQPAVRLRRRGPVRARLGPRPHPVAGSAGAQARQRTNCSRKPPRASTSLRGRRVGRRRLPSTPRSSAPAAGGGASWRGSARRQTTRSTNFSISHSTTSGARRRRCRVLSPGSARRAPRSSATWRLRATKCAS